jgi:hypothetical protein
VRRDKAAFSSGCKAQPAALQPEATGAAVEVKRQTRATSARLK